ncbi:MAG: 2OG-Fe(II) oxygenase, partial [Dokdonella sp.]
MHDASILAVLNPDVRERAAELHATFVSAEPFPHIAIDDFLDMDFARALLAEFPAFERGNAVGDNGEPGGKSTVDRIKALGPAYARLDQVIRSREFLDWLGALTGIDNLLYDPWYLGGGTHENRDGMSLDA